MFYHLYFWQIMSSNCVNVNNHSLIFDLIWSSSFKKKLSYINVQFLIKSSFIITILHKHLFSHKWFFVKLSFFISCVDAWDRLSKNRKIVFLSQKFDKMSLIMFNKMSLIKFDEILFIRFDEIISSNLTKCCLSNLIKSRLIKFDEIACIEFNESLSSNLMNRFRRIWWVISSSFCHFKKSS
jgi:hypothetical protein